MYLALGLVLALGLGLGIVLHFTSGFGSRVISDNDQQIFDFVKNDVSVLDFFLSKLLDIVIAFVIIFVCGLSIYSGFLIYAFFVYQGMIFASVCCEIIASYGFLGVVNVLVVLLPVNLGLFALLFFESAVVLSRASVAHRYKMDFRSSFYYERGLFKCVLIAFVAAVVFVLAVAIVLSLVLRAVTFVAY